MASLAKLSPGTSIETLSDMLGQINVLRASLDNESSEIAELWDGLGRAGGQRDDHAAALLCRLQPILSELATFCNRCDAQIQSLCDDPFGRNQPKGK